MDVVRVLQLLREYTRTSIEEGFIIKLILHFKRVSTHVLVRIWMGLPIT